MSNDDFSPIYVGDTEANFAPTFQNADGTAVNLSGATFFMKMENKAGTVTTCAGAWTIDDAANGKAHYQWQAADVATAGNFVLQIAITIGGATIHADPKFLQIVPVF